MRVVLAWDALPAAATLTAWYLPLVRAADGLTVIGPSEPQIAAQAAAQGIAAEQRPAGDPAGLSGDGSAALVVTERREERRLLGRRRQPLPAAAALLRLQGRVGVPRRIVFASAGGPQTHTQLPLLAAVARAYDASVTLLHVLSQQQLYYDGFGGLPLTPDVFLASDMPEVLLLQEAQRQLVELGVTARLQVEYGLVNERVLAACADHDLLAIGAQRVRGGLERLLLADLTRELLDDAPIPVLVLAEREQRTDGR
jgi:nucleotide-binding universal stress UspA family protein